MSSKKVASKETKAPAKKPAEKKEAVKAAPKKPAAKPAAKAPEKKTATASVASKSAAKVAEPKKKAPAKETPKAPAKKSASPVKKAAPAKEKLAKEKPVKVAEEPKKAPSSAAEHKKPAKSEPKVKPVVDPKPIASAKSVEKTVEKSASTVDVAAKKGAVEYDFAVLLKGVKKLSKIMMFVKVDEAEDRSNKKKMSSEVKNLEMKPTSAIRHKTSLAEETQEELTERILKELEEQNRMFEREVATQVCTRCNRNLVSPEFWVDKHLGYCEECASILKLGQSKEARKVEYQLGSMGDDSLDEEDDDFMGPDADDLKEAEEDLADMEE